jgi:hypothetical protein
MHAETASELRPRSGAEGDETSDANAKAKAMAKANTNTADP